MLAIEIQSKGMEVHSAIDGKHMSGILSVLLEARSRGGSVQFLDSVTNGLCIESCNNSALDRFRYSTCRQRCSWPSVLLPRVIVLKDHLVG